MVLLPDRIKRQIILKTTQLLPLQARARLRANLLGRLEMSRGRRAQYFVIGHPKSGNTWLRTMISRLYQQRYGLPESLVLKSDELHLANPACPRFLVTNALYSYEGVIGEALDAKRADREFLDRHVMLLARHPCDIAVSWYIQFTKRVSVAKREMINATLKHPIDHTSIDKWSFVMNEEIGLPSLIEFLNTWERNLKGVEHSLITRYEDLRLHPVETLKTIMTFFEQDFSDAEIEAAVQFGSFENMQKLESSRVLSRGGFSAYKADDPETAKVRRGQILGYRNDFDADKVAQMDRLVAERLSPTFGYTSEGVSDLRFASGA
jgi:hypothetical protein